MSSKSNKKDQREPLTSRQSQVLQVIIDAVQLRGYPPSIREIGDAAGLQSTSSVSYQLNELVRKGYVVRDSNKPRAVNITTLPSEHTKKTGPKPKKQTQDPEINLDDYFTVPLVGTIAAGIPITAEEHVENKFLLSREIIGEGEHFMLKVNGESMRDAGILDGDYVVVRAQNVAENGEIVAALIDGEATVKEYAVTSSGSWLLPHNPEFDDIPVTPDTQIQGKVVSLLRSF